MIIKRTIFTGAPSLRVYEGLARPEMQTHTGNDALMTRTALVGIWVLGHIGGAITYRSVNMSPTTPSSTCRRRIGRQHGRQPEALKLKLESTKLPHIERDAARVRFATRT